MMRWFISLLLLWCLAGQAQAVCGTGALPFNLQNNTIADATQVMANFNQISSGVGTNCASSGANTDITSLGGLITPLSQIYGGTWIWAGGTTTGSGNAQVLATVTPSTGFSLTQGKCVEFTAGFTNTGATTLNVFGTGATNVFRANFGTGATALQGGEIQATAQYLACYDGTQYELMNLPESLPAGARTNIAVAATVDLGTVQSHNAYISTLASPSTITSFGSSASTGQSIYYACFAAAHTLAYNATSMILPGTANISTAAGDCLIAMYLGTGNWQVVDYVKATGTAINSPVTLPSFLTLSIKNNAGTPNTQIDWSWNNASLLATSTSVSFYNGSNSGTINTALGQTAGGAACNAMDGEAPGTSTWLYLWAVSNGSTTCLMASKSSSNSLGGQGGGGINVPSGYIYSAYAGAMRVDGSGNLLRSRQLGADAQLVVSGVGTNVPFLTPMASANVGLNPWTAIPVANFVPTTAQRIKVILGIFNSNLWVAPNNNYPAYVAANQSIGEPCGLSSTTAQGNSMCDMVLEGTNIYYGNTDTRNGVYMFGWKDGVNAN